MFSGLLEVRPSVPKGKWTQGRLFTTFSVATTHTIQKFVTRTMSVSWQKRRQWWHMAELKSSSKIICFKLPSNALTDGEMQIII